MTRFQPNPFEPVRIYDAPNILASQVLDNEFTLDGMRKTLFDPAALSPQERDSFVQELKAKAGGTRFSDAVIDIATNPFVWLMFLTSAAGGSTLARAGRSIFDVGKKIHPFLMEHAPFLQQLRLLSPLQMYRGTAISPALLQVGKDIELMDREMAAEVLPPLREMLSRHNLRTLDPDLVVNPQQKALVTRINDTILGSLHGFDKRWEEIIPRFEAGKGISFNKVVHEPLVAADLGEELARLGATDVRNAFKRSLDSRRIRLFGKDEGLAAEVFEADPDKIVRLWRGLRNPVTNAGNFAANDEGRAAIARLMGPETAHLIEAGQLTESQFARYVEQIADVHPRFYAPKNMVELVGNALPVSIRGAQRDSRSFITTGQTVSRSSSPTLFLPDDLTRFGRQFGSTPAMEKAIEQGTAVTRDAQASGRGVHFFKLNGYQSLTRYFKDTGETASLYARRVNDSPAVVLARREANQVLDPKVLEQHTKSLDLRGGESIADVLSQQFVFLKSGVPEGIRGGLNYPQWALANIVLPKMTGRMTVEHAGSLAALLQGKMAMKSFVESGAGKAIKGQGGWSAGFVKRLDELADPNVPISAGRTVSGGLARYLYVTHLGLNMSSVVLNATQPFLLASTWVGAGNVLKGYGAAFKELGGYLGSRAKQGFKRLTHDEHSNLVRRHFKWANVEGEDLIGITRDTFESLDNISFARSELGRATQKESFLFDYPMKMFEKAEWLNRSVTAHAVESAYRKAGRTRAFVAGTDDALRLRSDVQQMVSETQFGGQVLNTPMLFLGNRVGDNPLMRQFLSFPLRSFTGVVFQGPRLAGNERLLRGFARDFVRGMGISAVIYESSKSLFNADLSRGLYAAAATDIFGGERFLEDGNEFIPVPPFIDIPTDFFRGIMADDGDLLRATLPRALPAGIAVSRAIGVFPDMAEARFLAGLPGSLQKTYANWGMRTPEGQVPVMTGDGRFLRFESGPALIMKGLGLDLGKFASESDLDRFLVKNREEIVGARREMLSALLANDVSKAQAIKNQFERRFGVPLTVTKQQLQQALRLRSIPRAERALDRLPKDVRGVYQELVAAGRTQALGVTPEELTRVETARQRKRGQESNITLDASTVRALRRMLRESKGGEPRETSGAFGGFEPF